MSRIVSKYDQWELNEARNSPFKPGDYVKMPGEVFKDRFSFQILQSGWSNMIASDSVPSPTLSPSRYTKGNFVMRSDFVKTMGDEALFYVHLERIGVKWAEGRIVFVNSRMNMPTLSGYLFRFDMKAWPASTFDSGPELKIFLEREKVNDDSPLRNGKFLEDDEPFVMDNEGKTKENSSGIYRLGGYNYDLTEKFKTTVVSIYEKTKSFKYENCLNVRLKDFEGKNENLPEETLEVIAKHMSKVIGAKVAVDDGEFIIPYFVVISVAGDRPPLNIAYKAGPFFTSEQAEKHIASMKDMAKQERLPFDIDSLKIDPGHKGKFNLTYGQLVEYVKSFGIDFDLAKFTEEKKGAIASKRFGF